MTRWFVTVYSALHRRCQLLTRTAERSGNTTRIDGRERYNGIVTAA